MCSFCAELDKTSGVAGTESIADIGMIYANNTSKWRELGIFLPKKTPTNRSCNQNENGWNYIATKWEKLLSLREKASKNGCTVEELITAEDAKEQERQRKKRARAKENKSEHQQPANNTSGRNGESREHVATRRRMNGPVDIGITDASTAAKFHHLFG